MQTIVLWGSLESRPVSGATSQGSPMASFSINFPQYGDKPDGKIRCEAFGKTAEKVLGLTKENASAVFQGYLDVSEDRTTKLIVMSVINPQDLNQCAIVGNMGADPDIRFREDGGSIASTRLAVRKKKSGGLPNWFSVAFFGKSALALADYARKGSQVGAVGRLVHERWTSKDGEAKEGYKLECIELNLLGKKPENNSQASSSQSSAQSSDDSDLPW